jgi:hypothetical protein
MPNVNSPLNGQAQALDLLVGTDGVPYLKAAGADLGAPTGCVDHSAPQLVQIYEVTPDADGNLPVALPREPTVFKSLAATIITGEEAIWTPAGGKKFRLLGFVITQGVVTGNITLRDDTAGSTILVIPATPVGQPLAVSLGRIGLLSSTADHVLTAQGESTETISGFVYGTEE